jgi:hypothetical protein
MEVLESGLRIESPDELPRPGQVHVQSKAFSRLGMATVRYCDRYGMKYCAGLEFSSTLPSDHNQIR